MFVTSLAPKHKLKSGFIALNGVGAFAALLSVVAWITENSLAKFWIGCIEVVDLTYGGGLFGLISGILCSRAITKNSTGASSAIATDDLCT